MCRSISRDTIPEEIPRRPPHIERRSTMPRPTLLRCTPRAPVRRHHTLGASLLSSSSSETSIEDEEDLLMKAGF